ncbi:lysylphosphatidylglycerol synthase transmembrane domain-containing protein [Micromonospora andamanensis]
MPTATPVGRSFWGWARLALGLAVLVGLLCWLGTGPFLAGLRLIDAPALAAALAIGVLTTVCAAWRWSLVAGGLGVRLPLREAVAHCYRAIFLNATLPGGILGDVHRAVRHGREVGDVGRGIRAVVWERMAGQVVLVVVAVVLLFAFPSPVRPFLPVATAVVVAVLVAVLLAARLLPQSGASRWARALGTAVSDVRLGLLARRTWAGVLIASALAVAGHLATFLVAARTAGSTAPLSLLLPLTLLALLAMGVPANVAGFGPARGGRVGVRRRRPDRRRGVATATVYGALVLVASLPGAAVLLARRVRVPATV